LAAFDQGNENNHQREKTWESIDMNGVELVGNPLGIIPPAPAFPPPPPPPSNVAIAIKATSSLSRANRLKTMKGKTVPT